jgi:hypothetical protein
VKRINVSAAFFLSIEFQETGYLVQRMYKTAYGDATNAIPNGQGGTTQITVPVIRLQEFLTDTQRLGQGVVVGILRLNTGIGSGSNPNYKRARYCAACPGLPHAS